MASSCSSSAEQELSSFKRFDVVPYVSDHPFFEVEVKPLIAHGGAAYKKIMQEWRILEEGLPDSIYVRAYDTRIDLMRAVIIGAQGTPYHDGLFFFDIWFPQEYPHVPPLVRYRSHGLRINPNIYACGHICLSLLNTWRGSELERWNPNKSTVLQVLVSIQGLVLNARPYFNEPPGYSREFGRTERVSRLYSERVFMLACKTAAFYLRNKPGHFEEFVVEHFRERARGILQACGAIAGGCARVGLYDEEGCGDAVAAAARGGSRSSRVGDDVWAEKIRHEMGIVYGNLVAAFKENGIRVDPNMEDFAKVVKSEKAAVRGRKSGVLSRAVDKMSKVFFAKKKAKEYDKIMKNIGFLFIDVVGVVD